MKPFPSFDSEMLRAALHYARDLGYYVIPCHGVDDMGGCACGNRECRSPGKHPIASLVPHGGKDANNSEATIRAWWRRFPAANIGIATGSVSGIIVVDVDVDKGADIGSILTAGMTDSVFATKKIKSGGGLHLYYRYSRETPVSSSQSRLGNFIDVKSDGGYVIAPPSRHRNGSRYEFVDESAPLREFPAEWAARLGYHVASQESSPFQQLIAPKTIHKFEYHEDRHEFLIKRIKEIGRENARGCWDAKCPAHNGVGVTSLGYDEMTRAVWCNAKCDYFSILAGFGLPTDRLPSKLDRPSVSVPKQNWQNAELGEDALPKFQGQPRPLDLTLRPVEKLDLSILPTVLRKWVQPAARVIGCPVDFLALPSIAIAGSLIGARLRVNAEANRNWMVIANMYVGIVGLPSTKKSPALNEVRRPLLKLQQEAMEDFGALMSDYLLEKRIFDKQESKIIADVGKGPGAAIETKRKLSELVPPLKPVLRRYETNDTTTSMLKEYLAENPNGIMEFRDELVGWFVSFDNDYERSARTFILELASGALTQQVSRRTDNREHHIKSGTLSVVGGIQPAKLRRFIVQAYSSDQADGFAQRFDLVFPDPERNVAKPTPSDYEEYVHGSKAAIRLYKRLVGVELTAGLPIVSGPSGDQFSVVEVSREGRRVAEEWTDKIEAEAVGIETADEAFASHLLKLPKRFYSVALIFHCLVNINRDHLPAEISAETIEMAAAFMDYLVSHARRVYALGENEIYSLANSLLGKIKTGSLHQAFTIHEVKRKQWSGLTKRPVIEEVVDLLEDHGYLTSAPPNPTAPGKPTTRYYFRPELQKRSADESTSE